MIEAIHNAFEKIAGKLNDWLTRSIEMLPNFVMAVILITIFILLAKFVDRILRNTLNRFSKNEAVNSLVASLVSTMTVLLGIFIALDVLNLDKTVTSLLAGIGIVGLALGFAFKDAASNFISGIYMAIKSPINTGDLISYEDIYGRVKEIGLRATTVTSLQGQDIIIPNRLLVENIYTHYTTNRTRRIDLAIGVSYGDDLEKTEKVTLEAVKGIDYILKTKPVDLYFTEFGDSSINLTVRYWVNFRKETDYLRALSDGIKNIKKAYAQNDITITFPIRTLDFGIKGGTTLSEMLKESEA
ncbi:MAG TPA: mechanosensitive ion channel family protein [Bacteroidales bacterium]|nr:mechanosensitive ion channel family protein [Bacteroidales bacterium]